MPGVYSLVESVWRKVRTQRTREREEGRMHCIYLRIHASGGGGQIVYSPEKHETLLQSFLQFNAGRRGTFSFFPGSSIFLWFFSYSYKLCFALYN
jgi:hypothetical protein